MLRGKLYTITNNTSSSSMIRFEDFKQSNRTNPTLADIEVIDALDDPKMVLDECAYTPTLST
jgi:hypothetical protein